MSDKAASSPIDTWPDLITKQARATISPLDRNGVFKGYASLFHRVDMSQDMVLPGAFAKTLRKRGINGIKMLYQHDPATPIGVWLSMQETPRGLWVQGQLAINTIKGAEVRALLSAGALDGLSIGFQVVKARTDKETGVRYLLEIDLWEVSIVTFPMLPQARVETLIAHGMSAKQIMNPASWPLLHARLNAATKRLNYTIKPHNKKKGKSHVSHKSLSRNQVTRNQGASGRRYEARFNR